MKQCPRCLGSGVEQDNAKLGEKLRKHRIKAGVGLRAMAQLCDVSPSYIANLEYGLRRWRPDLISQYAQLK